METLQSDTEYGNSGLKAQHEDHQWCVARDVPLSGGSLEFRSKPASAEARREAVVANQPQTESANLNRVVVAGVEPQYEPERDNEQLREQVDPSEGMTVGDESLQ
jgi:hypothetical protein